MMKNKLYVQFGAGKEAIPGWVNFDSPPTLIVQKIPVIGFLLRSKLNCIFDDEIRYGDILRGLPIQDESVDGLFCSHVLEHLTFEDFSKALQNCYRYLKKGGVFRIIVPDIEFYLNRYWLTKNTSESKPETIQDAANEFLRDSILGEVTSRVTIRRRLYSAFSNSHHRWMWDYSSLSKALSDQGFIEINRFNMGESNDEMFLRPERKHQFGNSANPSGLAVQCKKP